MRSAKADKDDPGAVVRIEATEQSSARERKRLIERNVETIHKVVLHDEFCGEFISTLDDAEGLVIIHCPYATTRRIHYLMPALLGCRERGVRICTFLKAPSEMDGIEGSRLQPCIELLQNIGIHVTLRHKIHEKVAIIDDTTLWEGSLNILSHRDTSERMNRWVDRQMVSEAVRAHELYLCDVCKHYPGFDLGVSPGERFDRRMNAIGQRIVQARTKLGMSQAGLAELAGIRRQTLARIESGECDPSLSTIDGILFVLGMDQLLMPWYMIPSIEERIKNSTDAFEFRQKALHGKYPYA